jgi:hypothetical protein
MSKAYWVNSMLQNIVEVEIDDLSSICIGKTYRNGDVLYVNDDGLHKYFFMVTGQPQPLSGDGIVVGPEVELEDDKWLSSVKQLGIHFLTIEDVRKWGQDNADVPSVSINGVALEYYGETIMNEALEYLINVMISDVKTDYLNVLVMAEYFAHHDGKSNVAKELREATVKYRNKSDH